jgi:hypothetical protein
MSDIYNAQLALDTLCRKVSLQQETPPEIDGIDNLPEGSAFWSSNYACLLLFPVMDCSIDGFQESTAMALDFLDGVLSERERHNKHADGYLVLALKSKPTDELDTAVRTLELSTNICRKNTIWPESDNKSANWARISDISVLGLPDMVARSSEMLTWPIMSEDIKALWLEIGGDVVQAAGDNNGR